ncbi:MAG: ribosome maturation factor RimP [Eubacteriaceae bacterium]|nr:ribosome maturation factor RimP [Eubacteriaceae bacterium]
MADRFIDRMIAVAEPVIEKNDCELVDAEYKKEGSEQILRFYVEAKEGRVTLDQCTEINREVSDIIDTMEDIVHSFVLEVSSPGIFRVLKKEKDYIRYSGNLVSVSLYKMVEGVKAKQFIATLAGFDTESKTFTFDSQGEIFNVEEKDVAKINLHFEF